MKKIFTIFAIIFALTSCVQKQEEAPAADAAATMESVSQSGVMISDNVVPTPVITGDELEVSEGSAAEITPMVSSGVSLPQGEW